jgi:TRAP-type C4-dicarboxylate transport system permease small subunit
MIDDFANKVAWVTQILIGTFVGIMCTVVVAEVILRYIFHYSLFFSEELSRLTFLWASLLAISVTLKKGMHISIQFVMARLPIGPRRIILLISQVVILVFLCVVFISAIKGLPQRWGELAATMDLRMFWFYLAVPVGVGLMIIQLLPFIRKTMKGQL